MYSNYIGWHSSCSVARTDCIRQLRWQPWNNAGSWKGKWEAGGSNGWRKWTDDVQSAATGNSSEPGANRFFFLELSIRSFFLFPFLLYYVCIF